MAGAEVQMLLLLLYPGLLPLATAARGDPFAQQLGPTSSCQMQCSLWIPHAGRLSGAHPCPCGHGGHGRPFHPSCCPKEELQNACARGCRLFAICRFVTASSEANVTLAECKAACLQAYDQAREQLACTEGCLRQMPDSPVPPPDTISVMDVLSNLCNKLISSAQSFISSTWTYYLQADNGKMVVFQVRVEGSIGQGDVFQRTHSAGGLNPFVLLGPKEKKGKTKGKMTQETSTGSQPEHNFLGCMSKRSGLPKWILASCLLFSVLVMLWLSCASLVTAPDQHVRNQPLSISGDKNYLDNLEWPLAPAPAPLIAIAVEPREAGSLPLKVEMDRTTL
uniref:Transmembrane protein 59 like n=1 Tax=Vombatus ursinus TaxID=29139 RepID=A0A4X2L7D1_VOMUR